MSSYTIQQVSSTATATGIVGALLIAQLALRQNPECDMFIRTHPQVRIEEQPKTFGQYTNLFTGEYEHSRSQQGTRISLREARKIALQILADTERSLQEERLAEARFIASLWDNEDWGV